MDRAGVSERARGAGRKRRGRGAGKMLSGTARGPERCLGDGKNTKTGPDSPNTD
jgi:hypothetical protein